ncbi:SgcJ/EcaC family oxidoreductase [Streptomyces sp. NPDC049627]|uniref:SgcJ/EcaC family oxidoreductase n=1 Tax=Streptomyces sp. NPDC049627 TaxID=3365595 RepID=UPI0037A193ED
MTTEAADKANQQPDPKTDQQTDFRTNRQPDPKTDEQADLEAIQQVVATVERTQRAKDPEGFLALFHPDALWTTAHGKVLIGLDAIAEFTRAVLPAATWDGEVTYEVAHTQFLRPDVAAVKVRQVYHSPQGDTEGAPLYVMTRQADGRWLLHACQNTEVRGA